LFRGLVGSEMCIRDRYEVIDAASGIQLTDPSALLAGR
jgi:hypothetical protein